MAAKDGFAGVFAKHKKALQGGAKKAEAREGKLPIPAGTNGRAQLTQITRESGESPRFQIKGNAVTPKSEVGKYAGMSLWLTPRDGADVEEHFQYLLSDLMSLAKCVNKEDEMKEAFTDGDWAKVDKILAAITKAKPIYLYVCVAGKGKNAGKTFTNFRGIPSDKDDADDDSDDDTDTSDDDDKSDDSDSGDDDSSDDSDDGDGDDSDDSSDDDDSDDSSGDDDDAEDGGDPEKGMEVLYKKDTKSKGEKAKVTKVDTKAKTVSIKLVKGGTIINKVKYAQIEGV